MLVQFRSAHEAVRFTRAKRDVAQKGCGLSVTGRARLLAHYGRILSERFALKLACQSAGDRIDGNFPRRGNTVS